jgi:hypothetical protein
MLVVSQVLCLFSPAGTRNLLASKNILFIYLLFFIILFKLLSSAVDYAKFWFFMDFS